MPVRIIGEGHQVRLVHLVQEVDRFLTLIITVNNQVKDIPGFCFQCDKLLAGAGCAAVIINQGQVPVRGQGATASAAKQFCQGGSSSSPREREKLPSPVLVSLMVR